jgi:hypothetical protein
MKNLVLFALLFVSATCFGQSKDDKLKEEIKKYEESGYFKVDGENIVVSEIIQDIDDTKDEIYIKVKNYLTRAYNNAQSVIQTDDKESGTIICKGYFSKVYQYTANLIVPVSYSTYHILRIDIKDGRVRVICSSNKWLVEWNASNNYMKEEPLIVNCPPYTDKKIYAKRDKTMEAFISLLDAMHNTISSLEKSIKEGSLNIENEDW